MICVASDQIESFNSIDKWKDLIRQTNPIEPIQLVLIDKSNTGSDEVVTKSMMQKKSDLENFEGVIVVSGEGDTLEGDEGSHHQDVVRRYGEVVPEGQGSRRGLQPINEDVT